MVQEGKKDSFQRVTGIVLLAGAAAAALSGIDYALDKYIGVDLVDGDPVFNARSKFRPPMPDSVEEYFSPAYGDKKVFPWIKDRLSSIPDWGLKEWSLAVGIANSQVLSVVSMLAWLKLLPASERTKAFFMFVSSSSAATFSIAELNEIYGELTASTALQWGGAALASGSVAARKAKKMISKS